MTKSNAKDIKSSKDDYLTLDELIIRCQPLLDLVDRLEIIKQEVEDVISIIDI